MRASIPLLLLAIAWPAAAQAEEAPADDQARARQLFEQGVDAARAEDLGAAIDAFVESYALYPHPGTLLNLGLYQLRAGRRVDAHATLSTLVDRWGDVISDRARAEVGERLLELEAALAFVTVSTSPPGAVVSLDGVELGPTPLPGPIAREPGPCTVEARLEGHEPAAETLPLRAGERSTVSLVLAPIADAGADAPPALVVESRTAGASASVDGAAPAPVPLRLALEPGEHEVALSAPGHASQTRRVTLPASGEVRLDLTLVPLTTPPPPTPRRRWPWIVGAVAAAAVVATAVALGVTLSEPELEEDWLVRVR